MKKEEKKKKQEVGVYTQKYKIKAKHNKIAVKHNILKRKNNRRIKNKTFNNKLNNRKQ